jgi:hypothetical protein
LLPTTAGLSYSRLSSAVVPEFISLSDEAAKSEFFDSAEGFGDREHEDNSVSTLSKTHTRELTEQLPMIRRSSVFYLTGAWVICVRSATIVICDSFTSNGLYSPVRPCESLAVTV